MLSITNLHKRHGDREILKGAALELAPAQVGVLIGPSGSGKSTLLRCVNGLETFEQGAIDVAGQNLSAELSYRARQHALLDIRRRVGMVFQQFHLFPHLSVLGNVIESPTQVLKKPREQAMIEGKALLDRVGLGDRLDSMPAQLSGGQQQRVAIARALAMRPDLILFDEPTSALDPQMTAEVLAVMADLARDGQTMLVVTHAMGFARKVANEVHVMSGGIIIERGPPDRIFEAPEQQATRELLQQAHIS